MLVEDRLLQHMHLFFFLNFLYFSQTISKLIHSSPSHINSNNQTPTAKGRVRELSPLLFSKTTLVSLAWTVSTFHAQKSPLVLNCLHVFLVKTITSHHKPLKHAHTHVKLIALKISSSHDTFDTENCFNNI